MEDKQQSHNDKQASHNSNQSEQEVKIQKKKMKLQKEKVNINQKIQNLMKPYKSQGEDLDEMIIKPITEGIKNSNKSIQMLSIFAFQQQIPVIQKDKNLTEKSLFLVYTCFKELVGTKLENNLIEITRTLTLNFINCNHINENKDLLQFLVKLQETFYSFVGITLKSFDNEDAKLIKYLKYLDKLFMQDKIVEVLLKTETNSLEYRCMVEQILILFMNYNVKLNNLPQSLLVKIIMNHKWFSEVAKTLSYLTRQLLLKLLQVEQGLGEIIRQNQPPKPQLQIINKQTMSKSKSRKSINKNEKEVDIIDKLGEPVILEQNTSGHKKENSNTEEAKIFGVLKPELVNQLSESKDQNFRVQSIEEISSILSKNLNIKAITKELDSFIKFLIKYINDTNEDVASIAIQLLNKVLSTISQKKSFDPKKLVPMLVKKYSEKNKKIRIETTQAFKHLLKIFRVRTFINLLIPYLQYPNFNIKQEIMNLMIYSFITSKGAGSFDILKTIKGLSQLIDDKNLIVRFIALEGLAYLTTIEQQDKIIKIVSEEIGNNKHLVNCLKQRFKLHPRVKINPYDFVEYPNLGNKQYSQFYIIIDENQEIMQLLQDMDPDVQLSERINLKIQTQFSKSQRILKNDQEKNFFQNQRSTRNSDNKLIETQQSIPVRQKEGDYQKTFHSKVSKQLVLPELVFPGKMPTSKDFNQLQSPHDSLAHALRQIKQSTNQQQKALRTVKSNENLKKVFYQQRSSAENFSDIYYTKTKQRKNSKIPLNYQTIPLKQ